MKNIDGRGKKEKRKKGKAQRFTRETLSRDLIKHKDKEADASSLSSHPALSLLYLSIFILSIFELSIFNLPLIYVYRYLSLSIS